MSNNMIVFYPWRLAAGVASLVVGSVSAYGAWKYAQHMGEGAEYLAYAAPVVAVAAAATFPMAKHCWKLGETVLSAACVLAGLLSVSFIFFVVSERSHLERASADAQRNALLLSHQRASQRYQEAKAKLTPQIESAEAAAKANPKCDASPKCRTDRQIARTIREEIEVAEVTLNQAEAKATAEAKYKPPVWLLGAAIEACAFVFIWLALSGPWWQRVTEKEADELVKGLGIVIRRLLSTKEKEADKPTPMALVKR